MIATRLRQLGMLLFSMLLCAVAFFQMFERTTNGFPHNYVWMLAFVSALFLTVMRAVRRVKDTWGRSSTQSESEAIASLVFPDLLILDEVGVQFGSDAERLILFDVLNERYEKRRPTLLLSNLNIDEVKAYLGERVFDRLREDGGEAIVFDWASWRGRIAA